MYLIKWFIVNQKNQKTSVMNTEKHTCAIYAYIIKTNYQYRKIDLEYSNINIPL